MSRLNTQMDGQSGQASRWERRALASGILFVAVALIGAVFAMVFVFPEMPAVDAPIAERAAYFVEHDMTMTINNYLLMLQVPFLLVFLAGLYAVLRRVEGDSGVLSLTALISGVAMVAMLYVGWNVAQLTVSIAHEGGDAGTISGLDALAPYSLALSAFPRAVLLGAVSLLVLERGLAARWIGIAGLALAVLHLLGTVTLLEGGFFPVLALGSLLFTVWTLALTVTLLRRPAAVTHPNAQAVPA